MRTIFTRGLLSAFLTASVRLAALLAIALPLAGPSPAVATAEADVEDLGVRPSYLNVQRLVIPVLDRHSLKGHFMIKVVIELNEGLDPADFSPLRRPLRDAMLSALQRYVEIHNDILYRVDLAHVKRTLYRAAAKVMGAENMRDVLVEDVGQRLL